MRPAVVALSMLVVTHGVAAQELNSVATARQLQGETDITVIVRFGLGEFRFARDPGHALYRASLAYDPDKFDPVHRYDRNTRTLDLGIEARGRDVNLDHLDDVRQRIDVAVTPAIPSTLDLKFGAGRANLDLGGLSLRRAKIDTGASESVIEFSRPTITPCEELQINAGAAELRVVGLGNANCAHIAFNGAAGSLTLDFTGEWQTRGISTATVNVGLGDVLLRFPAHLGVAVELNRFLASFDREGFERRGDRFVSPNYDDAAAQLNLRLRAVVGDVAVEWVGQ